ncbi:hypothetical protein CVT24_012104 [Panaeolus cyanescens]|uniref:Uncharacterized protein n=1 Tax=Panaeolus cyanescens TaxID=181874 RepID=A0A409X9T5_9AGAR|nr:hypothetical protein CVT24_012104 [Panaeolus cyanescens]
MCGHIRPRDFASGGQNLASPEISSIDLHLSLLAHEIQQFLLRTARWTASWFNKPKFHIIVHLPEHVRRIGPAILFATEAFESFNAVIRAKSVHSNRQAPPCVIAKAFAQGNRIRHIMSGGTILSMGSYRTTDDAEGDNMTKKPPFSRNHWTSLDLGRSTSAKSLGLQYFLHRNQGRYFTNP